MVAHVCICACGCLYCRYDAAHSPCAGACTGAELQCKGTWLPAWKQMCVLHTRSPSSCCFVSNGRTAADLISHAVAWLQPKPVQRQMLMAHLGGRTSRLQDAGRATAIASRLYTTLNFCCGAGRWAAGSSVQGHAGPAAAQQRHSSHQHRL